MTDKQAIRERVWDALDEDGVARFPFPPHGRIPNFAGAETAADRLADTDAWQSAAVVKANPDAPQLPVRRSALRDGKTVYMAVPRLRDKECFLELDPGTIDPENYDRAPALSNVEAYATQVGPAAVPEIDLVVSGSVAVTEGGARIGKGEGYSDLEYAILHDLGLVAAAGSHRTASGETAGTTVATTVHERQVVEDATPDDHDVPLDFVVTPERTIATETPHERPAGVDWDALSEERIAEIPVLERLQPDERL
ncbi:5-formyltetrahydrofolate cyclo-ligase [Salarchaeum sp. JOR-1]|uniref:5-formyltetrahydrofolate cyclo-ligase n=1 Tax=Salarchaeum sp. JOR-1 TaxID=2599399 RepID=UPI001198ADE1|nr:5-formyltetrahydrofolate cyclo-ligase [Salarchaeum sp. JOR-1]QDX40686.1 5-formyltetrahydrofolate cyclo-ligase [Salarchaeum sp. JOR-1]